MKTQLKGIALGLFVAMAASPLYAQSTAPAPASEPAEPNVSVEAGYGVGAALASVFYIPAKVTYAGLGLIAGGLGFMLSGGRADVANNIIYPAVGGNYVVTPSNLKGTEPIYFVGAPPPESTQAAQSAAPNSTVTR
jgi:hypothetical protein